MNLLLDTHAFIWWYNAPERLSQKVLDACQDAENTLILSVASVWEMQIKSQLNKLRLDKPLSQIIQRQQDKNRLQISPISLPVVLALDDLPLYHRDPFDRLLVAQSKVQSLVLVSNDDFIKQYPINTFWD